MLLMLYAQSAVALHDAVHHTHEHTEFCQVFLTAENHSKVCLDHSIELPVLSYQIDAPSPEAISLLRVLRLSSEARAPPKTH